MSERGRDQRKLVGRQPCTATPSSPPPATNAGASVSLARREELQRKSNAARRGVDVPPELEAKWKRLRMRSKGLNYSPADAAKALGLKFRGKAKRKRRNREKWQRKRK